MTFVNSDDIPFTGRTHPFWSTILVCVILVFSTLFVIEMYSKYEIEYRRYCAIKSTGGTQKQANEFAKETIQKILSGDL